MDIVAGIVLGIVVLANVASLLTDGRGRRVHDG
jgi:hypothetical protein